MSSTELASRNALYNILAKVYNGLKKAFSKTVYF